MMRPQTLAVSVARLGVHVPEHQVQPVKPQWSTLVSHAASWILDTAGKTHSGIRTPNTGEGVRVFPTRLREDSGGCEKYQIWPRWTDGSEFFPPFPSLSSDMRLTRKSHHWGIKNKDEIHRKWKYYQFLTQLKIFWPLFLLCFLLQK